jgi:hypothetical protein
MPSRVMRWSPRRRARSTASGSEEARTSKRRWQRWDLDDVARRRLRAAVISISLSGIHVRRL